MNNLSIFFQKFPVLFNKKIFDFIYFYYFCIKMMKIITNCAKARGKHCPRAFFDLSVKFSIHLLINLRHHHSSDLRLILENQNSR